MNTQIRPGFLSLRQKLEEEGQGQPWCL
jgi:hypothetical protein